MTDTMRNVFTKFAHNMDRVAICLLRKFGRLNRRMAADYLEENPGSEAAKKCRSMLADLVGDAVNEIFKSHAGSMPRFIDPFDEAWDVLYKNDFRLDSSLPFFTNFFRSYYRSRRDVVREMVKVVKEEATRG